VRALKYHVRKSNDGCLTGKTALEDCCALSPDLMSVVDRNQKSATRIVEEFLPPDCRRYVLPMLSGCALQGRVCFGDTHHTECINDPNEEDDGPLPT
jgi:hypothetical protein